MGKIDGADTAWLLICSALVLLMTPGLSFFYGGMVRPKNVVSTMLQSFVTMAVISLLWIVVGFSFPCHGIGGMVGMLMTGIFAKDVGLLSGSPHTFLMHCMALIVVTAFAFGGSYLLYAITDRMIPLRVPLEDEEIGLDLSQHGEVMQDTGPSATLPVFARIG